MRILFPCFLALIAVPLSAQTTGVPGINDFTVNGSGSGGTSCVASTLATNNTFSIAGPPSCGVTFVYSPTCIPGALPFGSGSVDIDLGNFISIIDGPGILGANGLSPLGWGDSAGNWSLSVAMGLSALTPGASFGAFQCAVLDPGFGGVEPTQAHSLTVTGCAGSTTWPMPPDDGSLNLLLTSNVSFYGGSYPDIWVNSNGFVSFGAGDADFTDSEAEWLGGVPRFGVWEDFQPNAPTSGPTTFGEDGAGLFTLSFDAVDNWASGGDNNTFCLQIETDAGALPGTITITMDTMQLAAGNDGLPIVGITPGADAMAVPAIVNSLDLSTITSSLGGAPYLAAGMRDPIYQDFINPATAELFDMANTVLVFTPTGVAPVSGAPTRPDICN